MIFLPFLISIAYAAFPFIRENNIIPLGEPTFEFALLEFQNGLLVYFYEEYCLPCRQFWPEFQQAANDLYDSKSRAQFAKLECHNDVKLCDKLGVKDFPTLVLFRTGLPFIYRGSRKAGLLEEWVRKVVDMEYNKVDSEDDLFEKYSTAILTRKLTESIFEAYSYFIDDIEIARPGPILKSRMGDQKSVIITQGGEVIEIPSEETPDVIILKIHDILYQQKTAVPNFTWEFFYMLGKKENIDFVLFFKTNEYKPTGKAAKAFDKVALTWRQQGLEFAYVNVKDDIIGQTIAKMFGVTEEDSLTLGIISKRGQILEKYKMNSKNINKPQDIDNFIKAFKDEKLKRYYMSASKPKKSNNYIRELTGHEYQRVTQDPDLHVFVMFYFPDCEWCLRLDPTWEALAYRLRHNKYVLIAKLDASENEIPGISFTNFPGLVFYPAGEDKFPIEYLKDQSFQQIKNFLSEYIPNLDEDIDL